MKINGKEVKLTRDKDPILRGTSWGEHNGVRYKVWKTRVRDPHTGEFKFENWVFAIPGWAPEGRQLNVEGWSTKHDAVGQAIRYIQRRQRWALEDLNKHQRTATPAKGA